MTMTAVIDFGRLGKDFAAFVADPTTEESVTYAARMGLKVSHTQSINGNRYHIVRYDKTKYSSSSAETSAMSETFIMTDEIAMLRSVIIADGKIRCLSLPKATRSMEDVPSGLSNSVCTALLEGPMVNVFYYPDENSQGDDVDGKGWHITTRSVFGARNSYYDDEDGNKVTFRNMFLEAMPSDLFNTLDRSMVYSYVVRHPKNRDVYGVFEPSLVLVASFKQRDDTMMVWDYIAPLDNSDLSVKKPVAMGITAAWGGEGGYLVRAKRLDDNYQKFRKLRGTQPKLKYHYLTLRKQRGAISQYLTHFPEHESCFSIFRQQVHDFTTGLQNNYWECFVRHAKPLKEYDGRYKQHMFNLHSLFKTTKKPMLLSEVIQYVNRMEPAQLMFSLNWENRPHTKQNKNENNMEE